MTVSPVDDDDALPYWMERDEPDWDADPMLILEQREIDEGVNLQGFPIQ